MEIKIYIDVLFFVNFIFDYLLLWMTGILLARPSSFCRLIVSALIGAVYATAAFFLPVHFPLALPFKLLMGAGITVLCYPPKSFRVFLQYICVFYLITFVVGGAAFCFFYFSDTAGTLGAIYRNGTLYVNIPVYSLMTIALLCLPIMKIAVSCGIKIFQKSRGIIPLHIIYQGKTLRLRGFYDSGNFLQEAISGTSVIITEWKRAKHLFPGCKHPEDTKNFGCVPVTYRTLGGNALLYAFLPEAIYIRSKSGYVLAKAVYIGLLDQTLDYYHNWDAILPHDFEGENYHETKRIPKTADFS